MSEDRPRHPLDPLTADEVVRACSLVRLDVTIDPLNSVYEVNTVADPPGPENPHHNAFRAEASLLRSEAVAQRTVDPLRGRFWKIVNPSVRNRLDQPVGYKLVPGENVLPFAESEAAVTKRATSKGDGMPVALPRT
jgi:primary-amine oxidase